MECQISTKSHGPVVNNFLNKKKRRITSITKRA